MAVVIASNGFSLDMAGSNLPSNPNPSSLELQNNVVVEKIKYPTVLSVEATLNGAAVKEVIAGNFTVANDAITGGTVSGLYQYNWDAKHSQWVLGLSTTKFSFSAVALYNAAQSGNAAAGQKIIATVLKGSDVITGSTGKDTLLGYGGNDKITGGGGADKLTGGAGADTFVYTSLTDSTFATRGRDTIMDFRTSQHDKFDLGAIDANAKSAGNQAFSFLGTKAFDGQAGELDLRISGGNTFVYGDVNGDRKADFAIELIGKQNLTATSFKL